MVNVVLTRIDDRLIHGQVMTSWVHFTAANSIVIVDDKVAKDDFLKSILNGLIPSGINLNIFNVDDGAKFLMGDDNGKNVIILVKTPGTVYRLLEEGVELKNLVIGGMGANRDRKKFYKNISASDEEKETIRKIIEKGVDVVIQIIPEDRAINVKKLL